MPMRPNQKYDWDKLFKRRQFNLVRGRDYTCQPHSMAQHVRNMAAIKHVHVNVTIDEGTVSVAVGKE